MYTYRFVLRPTINSLSNCRYEPSCSHYMEQAVDQYGLKGFIMGLRRIAACHPFSKRPIYDPVDKVEVK